MAAQCDIASFVLRFKQHYRQDEDAAPRVEWRGHIRHVQEDEELCFTDLDKAIGFIQDTLLRLSLRASMAAPESDPTRHEKSIRESLKLWKHFVHSHNPDQLIALLGDQKSPTNLPSQTQILPKSTSQDLDQKPELELDSAMASRACPPEIEMGSTPADSVATDSVALAQILTKLDALHRQTSFLSEQIAKLESQGNRAG
jgi:hypothetical protein